MCFLCFFFENLVCISVATIDSLFLLFLREKKDYRSFGKRILEAPRKMESVGLKRGSCLFLNVHTYTTWQKKGEVSSPHLCHH